MAGKRYWEKDVSDKTRIVVGLISIISIQGEKDEEYGTGSECEDDDQHWIFSDPAR